MFGSAMRRGAGSTILVGLAAVVLAACGSGGPQDAKEPKGKFPVQVVSASFPAAQRLSEHSNLVISIRNAGRKAIPDLAVTICNTTCTYPAPGGEGTSVAAFARCVGSPGQSCLQAAATGGIANKSRAVWIIDQPPGPCHGAAGYNCANGGAGGYVSADANTWQLGHPLKPGKTATFKWAVTAVTSGKFVVAWEVAAGLFGKAKAVWASGSGPCGKTPCGKFPVTIAHAPAQSYVNDSGQIVQQGQ